MILTYAMYNPRMVPAIVANPPVITELISDLK